jgi:hypothetical protein
MLFQIVLQAGVDGENMVKAGHGVPVVLKIGEEHIRAGGILGPDDLAVDTGEAGVVVGLYAGETAVLRAHKADDVGRQTAAGIIALCVGLELDAVQAVLIFKGAHPISRGGIHSDGHGFIPGAAVTGLLGDGRGIQAQDLRQSFGDEIHVLAVHGDLHGTEINAVRRGAHGQRAAAAVVDRALWAVMTVLRSCCSMARLS